MGYFSRYALQEAQVNMISFLIAFIIACNLAYQTYAIDEIQKTRKLGNNSTQSPQLQSTNVQVNVHNHFNLTLAIALPIGAAILSVLGWAIYKLRDTKPPTQPAEDAEVVAENRSIPEAEDTVAVVVIAATQ